MHRSMQTRKDAPTRNSNEYSHRFAAVGVAKGVRWDVGGGRGRWVVGVGRGGNMQVLGGGRWEVRKREVASGRSEAGGARREVWRWEVGGGR